MNKFVRDLSNCASETSDLLGGKGFGLARLIGHGYRVPPGFVITTAAYRACIAPVRDRIEAALRDDTDPEVAAANVARCFDGDIVTTDVADQIVAAYRRLGAGSQTDAPVAVRSSATTEDSADASFAGQQDTFLWVQGADSVIEHVARCWASLHTDRAIGYRQRTAVSAGDEQMAVVVQAMVPAEAAGVMMTLNPVTGARDQVYIESSFGLGESVVRGEVSPDCFTIAKQDLSVVDQIISAKGTQYRRGRSSGVIEQVDVDADRRQAASLNATELSILAGLGVRVERDFGRPMDIEWSVTRAPDGTSDVLLLQARPETVWATRSVTADAADLAAINPINTDKGVTGTYWTTANVGEAIPGVQTPLSWTVWQDKLDHGMRDAGYAMGILDGSERVDALAPIVDIFFGRVAVKVNFFTLFGDRAPGTTGDDLAVTYFGSVPSGLELAPTKRRYPIIAIRTPWSFARIGRTVKHFALEQNSWWPEMIARAVTVDLSGARALLSDAVVRHDRAVVMQCVSTLVGIQPVYDALTALAEKSGTDPSALSAIPGGPEMDVIADIWRASRGHLSVGEVVARHGFHGPDEGELSARVWREDATPLQTIIAQYAHRADAEDPIVLDRTRRAKRTRLEQNLLAALPRAQRPAARAVLALARNRIPLRGLAKRSMLQSFDVARAAARRIGAELAATGVLDDADDVFFLTVAEAVDPSARGYRELVTERRTVHSAYRGLSVPVSWSATPTPVRIQTDDAGPRPDHDTVTGVGVSTGIATGSARVLMAPDFAAVEPGEILVAPHTDPSWSSVMFLSAGLVVDIGGALSHTAVVARELGLPCVVNTGDGTRRIWTGDRIRVDGATGAVEVLTRSDATSREGSTP